MVRVQRHAQQNKGWMRIAQGQRRAAPVGLIREDLLAPFPERLVALDLNEEQRAPALIRDKKSAVRLDARLLRSNVAAGLRYFHLHPVKVPLRVMLAAPGSKLEPRL